MAASTPTAPPALDLEVVARLRVAIARTNRILRQQAGTGLPLSVHSALVSVEQHGPLSLGRLAEIEQVVPATVTKIVGRLVDDGLVDRTTDPTDRRVSTLLLTRAGARRLTESRSRRNAVLAERLDADPTISTDDLLAATELLERLARPHPATSDRPDESLA